MSIKVMSEVWDYAPYTSTELLILMALADMSNDERKCWPSLTTLAKKGRTTVQNTNTILKQFELECVLTITHRLADDGGHLSNVYYIHPPSDWLLLHAYIAFNYPTNAQISTPTPTNASISTLIKQGLLPYYFAEGEIFIEPSLEPSLNHHSKSPASSAGLEQAEPKTKSKKKPAPSKPKEQPAAKPTETKVVKNRKKLTPLQAALEGMQPYRELIHQMALLCKAGYADSMGDPEHSLTVKELQSYTEAAEDYFRLGGKLEQVQGLYKYVDNQNKQRTWKIAPTTLVKGIAGYQSQLAITAKRNANQQRNSPTGPTPVPQDTEAERAEKLRLIREGRERIQGAKQA